MSPHRDNLLNPTLAKVLKTFKLDKDYIRGEGCYLWDKEGRKYLDFIAQYGAVPFGYNPPFIWDTLDDIKKRHLPSLTQPSLPGEALRLANRLSECSPGALCYSTFCQSGTEAVEAAIKIARSKTGKNVIISAHNSFHGKTLGALSATGKASYQEPFGAPVPGFAKVPYNDAAALAKAYAEYQGDVAAFIVEPVQGEGGIIVAQPGYLKEVQRFCNENGIIFIVDEIQTGLGRTGRLFACEHEGIEPDVMLLAKALGGGMFPMAVCLSSPQVWNKDFGMLHSSTFANNGITCAIGNAVLDQLLHNDRELIKEVEQKGRYLLEGARKLGHTYAEVIKEVRGLGLMVGIEFRDLSDCGSYDMSYLADSGGFTALLAGYLLNVCGIRLAPFLNDSMTLRLEPSLTISYQQIDDMLQALDNLCHVLACHDYVHLYRYLLGDNARPSRIVDYRGMTRKTKSSALGNGEKPSRKFAFVIHYPGPEDVVLNNPSFRELNRDELYRFLQWQSYTEDPAIVCHMPAIRSHTGVIAEGWLIGVPLGGREIMAMPAKEASQMVADAVDLGRDLGAEIVGLGALTSVVTRGGHNVLGRNVAITSGNSLTTLMAIEALMLGARKMHIPESEARVAVVGATGSIGRACALLLAQEVKDMVLFGNARHAVSSRNRLNSLAQDILRQAQDGWAEGKHTGMSEWISDAIKTLAREESPKAQDYLETLQGKHLDLPLLQEICDYLNVNIPLRISLNLDEDLPQCNLVVAASNSPEYILFPHHFQPGAVVCDVARPADVAPEVAICRNDVLILEGGLVQYPDQVNFGPNFGYRDGVGLGCLSETILLAMEGEGKNYSIGTKLPLEDIEHLRSLGHKHGFKLAGLRSKNREITDQDIEEIYQNSLKLNQAQNYNAVAFAPK